jgi:hypothetical protein
MVRSFPVATGRGYIGLSFSGGGYRATAFSLGTMALLQDLELLGKARVMSSVSGGSLALAAYLCAKAGDLCPRAGEPPRQESEFRFYERFWKPLMLAFGDEGFAEAFVRLPLLLQGEKLVLHAADATQIFLNGLLGQEACLGNEAITAMLRERSISPDYLFINAANISSLDLFRFGLQRGSSTADQGAGASEPVLVLNRYFLRPEGGTVKAGDLYRHARHLRLGDCVAASFAFPGGFEPLIFPDDYFRPGRSPAGPAGAERAREQFSGSLICDRKPYVAFLDGGLYDNLGLASVEDIRSFLAKRWRDLEDRRHCPRDEDRGKEIEREQQIHYVIATDVDNIQPGVGFYTEPSLRRPPAEAPRPARRKGPLAWLRQGGRLLRGLVGLGVLPLLLALWLGFVAGVTLTAPAASAALPRLLAAVVALVLILAVLAPLRGGRWLRRLAAMLGRRLKGPGGVAGAVDPAPSWLVRLGLSSDFDRRGIDNDPVTVLLRALLGLLRSPRRAAELADLRAAVVERRLGQLLPAFNGYLKRTRSLTYGYLQQAYEAAIPAAGSAAAEMKEHPPERCHLIRNMIFELIPGPDVDPAYAANLITLPVKDYQQQAAIEPMAPVMRKLRHAEYVRDLLARFHDRVPHAAAGPLERDRRMVLPLKLLELDADLKDAIEQLNLLEAASVWTWLTASLELDGKVSDLGVPHPTIGRLVADVHRLLRGAMQEASRLQPGVAEPQIRQRCAVKLSEDATSYSWIPLICEMATNLNTTLWVKGYRWYLPNALDDNRIVVCGGWYVQQPPGDEDRPLLDLGALPAPAAAITTLAGYLSTCFNLLDFFYALIGSSTPVLDGLVKLLSRAPTPHDDEAFLQDLVDLPYVLRRKAFERLERRSRCPNPPITPVQLALLEPWLTSRDGFPDSWRETFGTAPS